MGEGVSIDEFTAKLKRMSPYHSGRVPGVFPEGAECS